jgi:hypothetical protein
VRREKRLTPEEEESDEKTKSGHIDDEEDVDDINHETLSKEAVRANTHTQRAQREDIWKNVRIIANHDVTDSGMNAEYTHVCVYRLDNGEGGEKRFCNTPLKLFRSSKGKEPGWSTSAALTHFKNKHEDSSSTHKQKAGDTKRQSRLGECMHTSASVGLQSISSKKNTYGLSEKEKVLSAIARWGTCTIGSNSPMGHVC